MGISRNLSRVSAAALLFAFSLLAARAASPAMVTLGDSIRLIATAPASGTGKAHPFVSRATLKANEKSAVMTFEVALKLRNSAEMKARVESGDHISPQDLAEKYEPLASDYQAVVDWLTSQGLTIAFNDSHHLTIFARGTVSQVQAATRVTFARVTSEGKEYTSAVTAPSVPASLSPLLVGINGLQPHIHAHKNIIHKNLITGTGSYTPAQIAQAYQATALYNAGITGAGQTIAIVIDAYPTSSDLTKFWTTYGIAQSINNIVDVPTESGTDTVSGEETLDTEWSSAMAPGAKIRVYVAQELDPGNLDLAYEQVLADAASFPIHQMSMSYGEGETDYNTDQSQITTDNNLFLELTNAGVTCFASSGDQGATPAFDSQGNQTEDGTAQPEFPASDTYVIGVGGTTLTSYTNANASTETAWNSGVAATGGGTSAFFSRPSWQTGAGVPSGTKRLVPDIASAGDPNYGADIYYTDPSAGLETTVGGTSWSSPTCAGFCALINQARAQAGLSVVGNLGPLIYPLIGTSCFRDIIGGSNVTANSPGQFLATVGYDEVTGIGVPLVQPLAQALTGGQSLAALPGNVTVDEGANAVLSLRANGTPTSFQWQRMAVGTSTWANLTSNSTYAISTSGASSTLTVNGATTAMSGDQFQCVVSYSGGVTLTSNPTSALTVEIPWTIATLAGHAGSSGTANNNTGTLATFDYPTGIAIDPSGNLYVTDLDNNLIREVTPAGVVSTPYGDGTAASVDGTGTGSAFDEPRDITAVGAILFVTDEGSGLVRMINTTTKAVSTLTTGTTTLSDPKGIGTDSSGNVYVSDAGDNVIWKLTPVTQGQLAYTATILAGSHHFDYGYQDSSTGANALFNEPLGLTVNKTTGDVYVTDYYNCAVRKITSAGAVTTVAGSAGLAGCLDGTGTQALFNVPRGIAIDSSGNLYVADSTPADATVATPVFSGNNLLREISAAGVVTTLAGQAASAGTSDGTGTVAQFYNICGVALGSAGQLYLADASNNTIRTATLVLPTVAVTATQANASVKGPVTGQFQVTRTGSTATSLTVNYSTSGSAVSGTDYAALPGAVTIPVGASSATITVTPYLDSLVNSSTLQITLTGPAGNVLVNSSLSSATVTIAELQSSDLVSYSTWQTNNPVTTPTTDGVPAPLKYLFDIDPSTPMSATDFASLPSGGKTTIGQNQYLTLTYRRYLYATNISVNVQTSTDMVTWTTVNPPNPNLLSQQVGVDPGTGDPIWEMGVVVPANTSKQFIRLDVTQP